MSLSKTIGPYRKEVTTFTRIGEITLPNRYIERLQRTGMVSVSVPQTLEYKDFNIDEMAKMYAPGAKLKYKNYAAVYQGAALVGVTEVEGN